MIRKSMPSGYDPMGGRRFSLATNAKRLRGDHAQTTSSIPFWAAHLRWIASFRGATRPLRASKENAGSA